MAFLTPQQIATWQSGAYVGENTPSAVVQVQLGVYDRAWWPQGVWEAFSSGTLPSVPGGPYPLPYQQPGGINIDAEIQGENSYGPIAPHPGYWFPLWFPKSGWYDVPNIFSIKRTKDFSSKGITVCEIVIDCQDYEDLAGLLGDAYHLIVPGALAPYRDYVSPARIDQGWGTTEWSPGNGPDVITDSVKVRIWQGYGAAETSGGSTPPTDGGTNGAWTFAGMIDQVDADSEPNQLTITARNGKLLTDQRVFRAAKSVQLRDPITFYDRRSAQAKSRHGKGAQASSFATGFPPRNVLDPIAKTFDLTDPGYWNTQWMSANNIGGGNSEWIEIRLPQGAYTAAWLFSLAGMQAYIGIYAFPLDFYDADPAGNGLQHTQTPATVDGLPVPAGLNPGWIDLSTILPVPAQVTPGSGGGWPYVKTFVTGNQQPSHVVDPLTTMSGPLGPRSGAGGSYVIDNPNLGLDPATGLGITFELGNHSILRIAFDSPAGTPAIVGDLRGLRSATQKEIQQQQYILVNDASAVVEVVLRWAGYNAWNVEKSGVSLSDGTNFGPNVVMQSAGLLSFNRSHYLIDVIDEVAKQLGFVFFIADPIDGDSDGIPTFRHDSSLLQSPPYVAAEIDDTMMLTGLKVKHTDEDRPFVIRVRGKTATPRHGGMPLGGDRIDRIMAVYFPPWSLFYGTQVIDGVTFQNYSNAAGGVLRHIVYQDDQLTSYAMCLYGCFLIALQAAQQMHTAVAEIPTLSLLELDDQVGIVDEATATNSRLWIVKLEDTMTLGQNANWVQTVEGTLLDTQDMQAVIAQALGLAPILLGTRTPTNYVVPAIDWTKVVDPHTLDVSSTGGLGPPAIIAVPQTPTWNPRLR